MACSVWALRDGTELTKSGGIILQSVELLFYRGWSGYFKLGEDIMPNPTQGAEEIESSISPVN